MTQQVTTMGRHGFVAIAVRTVAGVLGVAAGLLWATCTFVIGSSRLTTDQAYDPHGFGLIFGSMLALASGLVAAIALPFAFPSRLRSRVTRIAVVTYVVCSTLLVAAWLTAS